MRVRFGPNAGLVRVRFGSSADLVRVRFGSSAGLVRIRFGSSAGLVGVGCTPGAVWLRFGCPSGAGRVRVRCGSFILFDFSAAFDHMIHTALSWTLPFRVADASRESIDVRLSRTLPSSRVRCWAPSSVRTVSRFGVHQRHC